MLISIFFIGYVVWEVPSNIVMARTRPSLYLPGLMVVWGALVAGMSQTKGYHDILIYRFFLGVIEAGFLPGVMYLMSCWYKKSEIGTFYQPLFLSLSTSISGGQMY
jgi:MFS family permease